MPGNERYYTVVQGPVQLFAIDSDDNEPDGNSSTSAQAQWLKSALAASTATWKLVYFHHAAYSSGSDHGSSTWMQWDFAGWGASAVLSGHDHDYERLSENGIPYFVDGTGGAGLYSFGTPIAGSQVRYNSDWGALKVDASSTQITFQFITRTGAVIDSYSLSSSSSSSSAPAAPSNLTASAASTSQINLAWTDNSNNETGFKVEQATNGTTFAQVGTVAANIKSYSSTGLNPSTK